MHEKDIEVSVEQNHVKKQTTVSARFDNDLVMGRLGEQVMSKALGLLVSRYVEDKYQEISRKIDTEAIAKQLVLAVTTALADKTVSAALIRKEKEDAHKS